MASSQVRGKSLGKVLVVDDEKNITAVIQAILERAGFEVTAFNDPKQALQQIASVQPDLVITDLSMPGIGGMDVLEHCKRHLDSVPVVIITAYGTVESAVTALKLGAFDYVSKPFDQAELLAVAQKAVATHQERRKETFTAAVASREADVGSTIIGTSPEMAEVRRLIAKVADSPSTVLITGESGTGKEIVATEIHHHSGRAQKPLIRVNCAAIPATLIESELFGYEKGAFTGAVSAKPGRFELAHEGTLFLDEVAEMTLEMQVKLLRAIQEHEFERVGGVSTVRVDVRIIAATNRDLEAEVAAGRFREDLFYRLNVVPIHVPPLRERVQDIELFVQFFLHNFNQRLRKSLRGPDARALALLKAYKWPGNIRQLENVLERMVLMAEGDELGFQDIPREVRGAGASGGSDDDLAAQDLVTGGSDLGFKDRVKRQTQTLERELIDKALDETQGNVTRAAEKLGLSRKGLQLKIKELGLKRPLD